MLGNSKYGQKRLKFEYYTAQENNLKLINRTHLSV